MRGRECARRVDLRSRAAVDAPLAAACARVAGRVALVEYGLGGDAARDPAPLPPGAGVSVWLAGDDPAAGRAALARWRAERRPFRFLFPERLFAPAAEAKRLFTGGDLGTTIHLHVRVQAHPARLLRPEAVLATERAWLAEPALNRLPLAVWMQGPVADARVLLARRAGSLAVVLALRHARPTRQSILELSVSEGATRGGQPAILDSFEATGRDGFVRVNGIWDEAPHAPRLSLHRGALEVARRDLPRDFAQVHAAAAAEARRLSRRLSKESYSLAAAYLEACARVLSPPG